MYSKIEYLKEGDNREKKLTYSVFEYVNVNGHFSVGNNTHGSAYSEFGYFNER